MDWNWRVGGPGIGGVGLWNMGKGDGPGWEVNPTWRGCRVEACAGTIWHRIPEEIQSFLPPPPQPPNTGNQSQ